MAACRKCGKRLKRKARDGHYRCNHCGVQPRGLGVCRAGLPIEKRETPEGDNPGKDHP